MIVILLDKMSLGTNTCSQILISGGRVDSDSEGADSEAQKEGG